MTDGPNGWRPIESAPRVVRLAPWLLEVVKPCPGKKWDEAAGNYEKRKDAERAAKALTSPPVAADV